MSETMPRACVMGHPVAHSRSPMLHGHWLKYLGISGSYELADVVEGEFPAFLHNLRQSGYVGGNITVPHKEAAFRLVDRHEAAAQAIGAVNTVWYEDGRLVGGNTDAYGFLAHLDAMVPEWSEEEFTAIVLGAGGAARAILHALTSRHGKMRIVNRSLSRAADLVTTYPRNATAHELSALPALLREADLLVNATSLGMAGKPPLAIDLAPLKPGAIVYDIVYVPLETALLREARARRHRTVDGLGMLLHQAVPGFARWFGVTPTVTPELRALIETDLKAK